MLSEKELNTYYDYLTHNTSELLPDGVIDVDLKLLQSLNVLSPLSTPQASTTKELLQTIETGGKVTLFNEHFVLWIVPQCEVSPPSTTVIVARCLNNSIKPEVAFKTTGIHNQSKTILQLIDRYLVDIQETENVVEQFEEPPLGSVK